MIRVRAIVCVLVVLSLPESRVHAQLPQDPATLQPAEDPKVKEFVAQALVLQQQASLWQPTTQVAELELRRDNLRHQINIYLQILALSSGNAFAISSKTAADRDVGAVEEKIAGIRGNKAAGDQAMSDAYKAMQRMDLMAAATAIATAKRVLGDSPQVDAAEKNLNRLQLVRNIPRFGVGVLLTGALGWALMVWRGENGRKYASLLVLKGVLAGKKFPADGDTIRIGSVLGDKDQRNDLVVEDGRGRISRYHCVIQKKAERWYLIDNNSTNCTWVNQVLAKPQVMIPLKDGAIIDLARCCLVQFSLSRTPGA